MKISTDPSSDWHHQYASYCRIFLEGSERWNVITADEEARTAHTARLDDHGKIRLGKDGLILTDTFTGHVRIEAPPWLREEMERKAQGLLPLGVTFVVDC